jgi:hypothetical protein
VIGSVLLNASSPYPLIKVFSIRALKSLSRSFSFCLISARSCLKNSLSAGSLNSLIIISFHSS